jgi:hypothetical protein
MPQNPLIRSPLPFLTPFLLLHAQAINASERRASSPFYRLLTCAPESPAKPTPTNAEVKMVFVPSLGVSSTKSFSERLESKLMASFYVG